MSKKPTYKQSPKVFKEEAVALVRKQGYSVAEAAKSVEIATNMLSKWKEKIEAGEAGHLLEEDERAEFKRLPKEKKDLRVEKDILKKANAFFAKEMK